MAVFNVSPKETAAGRMRELVRRIAVDAFDAHETDVPIPGFTVFTDRRLDDPLCGVRSALFLRNVAEGQLYEHARSARSAGRSWDDVGAALDLPAYEHRSRAEVAFGWLVEGRAPETEGVDLPSFRTPTSWWRCATCEQQVADRGPFESHPDDNEQGHAASCARHRADVDEWRQRVGGEN